MLFRSGKYGSIVKSGDIDDLAEKIVEMTKKEYDQNEINDLVDYVKNEFSWDRICNKLFVAMNKVNEKD